jgi:hypothetical protein
VLIASRSGRSVEHCCNWKAGTSERHHQAATGPLINLDRPALQSWGNFSIQPPPELVMEWIEARVK